MRVKWLFRGSFEAKVVNLVVELVNKKGYRDEANREGAMRERAVE